MHMNHQSENEAKSILANPFSAIVFADHIFKPRKLAAAKEDWILLNAKLIEETGSEIWLEELLNVLSLPLSKFDGHDIVNPGLAISVSKGLQGPHELVIAREQWAQANSKLVNEIGANAWLWQLIETLETGVGKQWPQ
jgi:hypothetical protein